MAKRKPKHITRTTEEIVQVGTLGSRIKAYRMEMSQSEQDVAEAVGIDVALLISIENDKVQPDCETLKRLWVEYDYDLHHIITGYPADMEARMYVAVLPGATLTFGLAKKA